MEIIKKKGDNTLLIMGRKISFAIAIEQRSGSSVG